MPTYEFECEACHQIFERRLSVSQRDKGGPCPHCKSKKTKRVMSAFLAGVKCAPSGGT